ncbi:hypothetical protein RIF29_28883 [Crotalaria pallida]|uniref:Auxin-induced protein n=1 Tax=Crotalaria pallida TaxID=3830 RepID=A0AAN9HTD2_CROPI
MPSTGRLACCAKQPNFLFGFLLQERKLELRLGPPGEYWHLNEHIKNSNRQRDESLLFVKAKDASQLHYCSNVVDLQNADNKALFSPSSANTLPLPNNYQKSHLSCAYIIWTYKFDSGLACDPVSISLHVRTAPGSVVGWPPIRSIRKNFASGSTSKLPPKSQQYHQHIVPNKVASQKPIDNSGKGLFVKINMDGVPIGRKVDINAYGNYENLSSAVDKLFRGLLPAIQRDSSACGIQNKEEKEKEITGLLVGSGEYTLVYEDNEGDKMLVGDVPWQ